MSMSDGGTGLHEETKVIEATLDGLTIISPALIAEGHYFLLEDERSEVIGAGGWSRAVPGYAPAVAGADHLPPDGTATVRAIFVSPAVARRGLGTRIMSWIERDAADQGIRRLELAATLSGVPLYRRLGYRDRGERSARLPCGRLLPLRAMDKEVRAGRIRVA